MSIEVNLKEISKIAEITSRFFHYFYEEYKSQEIALELTKEAMTTYRTLLIQNCKEQHKDDSITDNQLQFLEWKQGEFAANRIIQEELERLGKHKISELTKQEASHIITKIKEVRR